jgi:hypothetical protein
MKPVSDASADMKSCSVRNAKARTSKDFDRSVRPTLKELLLSDGARVECALVTRGRRRRRVPSVFD